MALDDLDAQREKTLDAEGEDGGNFVEALVGGQNMRACGIEVRSHR
jgi:hypothetical protein